MFNIFFEDWKPLSYKINFKNKLKETISIIVKI